MTTHSLGADKVVLLTALLDRLVSEIRLACYEQHWDLRTADVAHLLDPLNMSAMAPAVRRCGHVPVGTRSAVLSVNTHLLYNIVETVWRVD
jgi:hypothetical protein